MNNTDGQLHQTSLGLTGFFGFDDVKKTYQTELRDRKRSGHMSVANWMLGRSGKETLERSMVHLLPFALIPQSIHFTGAVGPTRFAKH